MNGKRVDLRHSDRFHRIPEKDVNRVNDICHDEVCRGLFGGCKLNCVSKE